MTAAFGTAVPLCDLQTQYRTIQTQIEESLSRVLASGQVILGPEVSALEEEIAAFCGARRAVGCGSGSDALMLALQALDIGPGDEVVLPTFTFFATAGMVCRLGGRPVFADIDPGTFNLDPQDVEQRITQRTRAIIAVHLFGQCAAMKPLTAIAAGHEIPIIEDAAQAFGAEYQGQCAGTLATIGCFSFYPSKNLGAYGDAGMVVTNNATLAARMACLRVHGMEPKYYHRHIGWNARLDALQAAILRVKLPYVAGWTAARQAAARRYDELIAEFGLDRHIQCPTLLPGQSHVFHQYVVRVADGRRAALQQYLKAERIGCEVYYPVPLHLQECFAYLGYRAGEFPVSETACSEVLALPMFPEIAEDQQARVIRVVAAFLHQQGRAAA